MYLQLDICICQRYHLLELTELEWDGISNSKKFKLVESDRNNWNWKLEMVFASDHIKPTKPIHSSLPKKLSECV